MSDPSESTGSEPTEVKGRRKIWKWLVLLVVVAAAGGWFYTTRYGSSSRPELESAGAAASSDVARQDVSSLGWNRFRGPNGTGLSADKSVPLTWGDTENLAWKMPIPGDGSSSPVVTEHSVFVTSYTREDDSSPEIKDLTRHIYCVDRTSGEMRWSKSFEAVLPEGKYNGRGLPEHGYATSTTVTDGEHLYVFFGKSGVYCLDLDGNEVWQASVGDGLNRMGWGSCSSPILYGDIVIVNAGEEASALIALNKQTGDEVWRSDAPRLPFTFGTPALVDVGDRIEIVIAAVGEIWGLNPKTGKLVWYATSPIGSNCSPSVVVDGKLVYAFGGYGEKGSICVEAGGRGDVTDSKVRWTSKHTPYISTPVVVDGKVCWVDGVKYFALDAESGDIHSRGRLPAKASRNGGRNYASAIAVGGNVLVQTCRSGVVVLEAGADDMSIVSVNRYSDQSRFNATPAASNGQLFLRSDDFLYCVAAIAPGADSTE
ncbi:MAG: PQQ-binding-like beta-propeller repeat protein [Planctomycetaceae bacterium]